MLKEIKDSDFAVAVLENSNKKLVLVDFWASWCGPCLMQTPILEEIAKESRAVDIVKINVDENSENASTFNIKSIPTLILFKNGHPVQTIVGLQTKTSLQTIINSHI